MAKTPFLVSCRACLENHPRRFLFALSCGCCYSVIGFPCAVVGFALSCFFCCCGGKKNATIFVRSCLDCIFCVQRAKPGQPLMLDGVDDSEADVEDIEDLDIPVYWHNKDGLENFDERYDVPMRVTKHVQKMLKMTWKDVQTRDRKGKIPLGLCVVSVQRVEDRKMWAAYQAQKKKIQDLRGSCQPAHALDGKPDTGMVKTLMEGANGSGQQFQDGLDSDVNEFYLFHGTSPEAAFHISEDGFRLDLSGTNAGSMFGKGAYLAECSSKADEYAQEGTGIYRNIYAMLLCRVVCGSMFRIERSDQAAIQEAMRCGRYDAVLGDRGASVGTYREFVVFRERQIYPEYVVLYKRLTEDDSDEDDSASSDSDGSIP